MSNRYYKPKIHNPEAYARAILRNKGVQAGVRNFRKETGLTRPVFERQVRRFGTYAGKYIRRKAVGALEKYGPRLFGSMIEGSGDYTVGKHVSGPKMQRHGHETRGSVNGSLEKGIMRIKHSEYIGDLISPSVTNTFLSQVYGVNAENSGTFPWLSGIASNFESYQFHQLVFEYIPLVSESTSSSTATLLSMGAVIMASNYNVESPFYVNKPQMENSDFSVSGKPSEKLIHCVECKSQYNPLGRYFCSDNVSPTSSGVTNSDLRFQNLCQFGIASNGVPVASSTPITLGEIWCHYEVTLFKPILGENNSLLSGHWQDNSSCGNPVTTTPFGPNVTSTVQPTQAAGTVIGCTFSSNGTITFPLAITSGQFLVTYSLAGTAVTLAYSGWTAVQGCSLVQNQQLDTVSSFGAPANGTTLDTYYMCQTVVNISAPGSVLAQIRLVTTVIPTSGHFDVFITPFNQEIIT